MMREWVDKAECPVIARGADRAGEYRNMSKLPKELKGQLPTPEQIEVLLRDDG
jgi:hypothetical protein